MLKLLALYALLIYFCKKWYNNLDDRFCSDIIDIGLLTMYITVKGDNWCNS